MNQPAQSIRIASIDVLRGFALLGLLSMNIISFSMPNIAYYNPTIELAGGAYDFWVYSVFHVMADQKFMALFSLLFGASTLLILQGYEQAGNLARRHFVRNTWLVLFGLLHGVLLWEGDVLLIYGLSAMVLYFMRNLSFSTLGIMGVFFYSTPILYNLLMAWMVPQLDATSLKWLQDYWSPESKVLLKDIALFQGSFSEQLQYRLDGGSMVGQTNDASELLGLGQLIDFFGRALGMMMLGMMAFKTDILTGKRTVRFYRNMLFVGLAVGVPIAILGLYWFQAKQFDAIYSLFMGRIPNHIATLFIAAGYIGLIHLMCATGIFKRVQGYLASVGKMALTNYVGQTLIATVIFYGIGFGLYGQLSRLELLAVMVGIWLIQIVLSVVWLRYFIYGPLEWLWRSLSQFSPAKMRQNPL